jgi:hypothetical protein
MCTFIECLFILSDIQQARWIQLIRLNSVSTYFSSNLCPLRSNPLLHSWIQSHKYAWPWLVCGAGFDMWKEWNDRPSSSPLSRDPKIVCAKNASANKDHGKRCRRFSPFLKSTPITTCQDYVALCRELPRVANLFVLYQETRKFYKRDEWPFFHEKEDFQVDGDNTNLYATECFCILQTEGHAEFFFTGAPVDENLETDLPQFVPREIQNTIECGRVQQDDMIIAWKLVKINKKNAENTPQAVEREWGHPVIWILPPGTCLLIKSRPSVSLPRFPRQWNVKVG